MPYFENLGFFNHPFVKTNADEEPLLEKYFVPPPFFEAVIGDPKNPSSSIVLAPRGAGKSAQRRKLEMWAPLNRVLAVTYDRFEFSEGQKVEDIGLLYHIRNIIIRLLITYLSYLLEYPDVMKDIDKQSKKALSIYIKNYLGNLTGSSLQTILKELKSLPEKFKEFWAENVGVLESVVNLLLKKLNLESIDLPNLPQEEKKLNESYKFQLEFLRDLISKIGFDSVYVLIDKVDETEKTGNDSIKTYNLIQPLIKDLELLGLKGFGFKFFVWNEIIDQFRKDARPDRISQFEINWTRKQLESVLSERMKAFSNNKISSMSQLLDKDPDYPIDSVLCLLANRSPRNLIRICESIFSEQGDIAPNSNKISELAIDRGILKHVERVISEQYGEDISKDIQRVGQEAFTINYLSNVIFKTAHENTSRNKVTTWQKAGIVSQLGTVILKETKRPVNFYYVTDPAMIRLIHRNIPLKQFIRDRWLICNHCEADNLIDLNLIPQGNEFVCHECNRKLL